MKVVIAHDYLTQRGGAERVVLDLAEGFPGSTIFTSVYNPDGTYPEFRRYHIESFAIQSIGPVRRNPRLGLPVLADLFRHHRVEADLLICSSSGFAHLIRARAPKIVYCHNPPRWLHQWSDYAVELGRGPRLAMGALRHHLLALDRAGAAEADVYLANSANVARRIQSAYGRTATVVHPPRGLDPHGPRTAVPGLAPGFLLTVGRPRGYKRTDMIMEAVAGTPDLTLVTVGCSPHPQWPSNIRQLVGISDAELRWLYANAAALVACSREDFGLTPVEAFAFGTPVGATREGGYLETCVDGLTGTWIDVTSCETLRASIRDLLARPWDAEAIRRHGARWTRENFQREISEAIVRAVDLPNTVAPIAVPHAVATRADAARVTTT